MSLREKDFLPARASAAGRSLLPHSPRPHPGSPKTTPALSVWPSPDVLPPPRRPLEAQECRLRLKQLPFRHGGPLYLNPQPVSLELTALAPSGLLPRRSASASLSARKICPAYFFDRNRTSKKLRQLPKPRLSAAAHYNQLTKSTNHEYRAKQSLPQINSP